MPEQSNYRNDVSNKFNEIDKILGDSQHFGDKKMNFYKILAAILHLGNIEFDDSDNEAKISKSSETHIQSAAKLLNVPIDELRNVFLSRRMDINTSSITYESYF